MDYLNPDDMARAWPEASKRVAKRYTEGLHMWFDSEEWRDTLADIRALPETEDDERAWP